MDEILNSKEAVFRIVKFKRGPQGEVIPKSEIKIYVNGMVEGLREDLSDPYEYVINNKICCVKDYFESLIRSLSSTLPISKAVSSEGGLEAGIAE
jgi:hypothetical protein